MKEKKKIIIGLVGEMGSGKDTSANYLAGKYEARLFRFQDPLREAMEIFFGKGQVARAQMIWLSNSIREKYGNGTITEALRRRIGNISEGVIVFNGMRIEEDFEFVKSFPDSYVVYITLDSKTRWKRVYERGEKSDDAISYEKFLEMEKAETEVQIPALGKKADFRLVNEGAKDELGKKMEEIMGQIKDIA
jgi:dephospho-CoA kinase